MSRGKDVILDWCKKRTSDYKGVMVTDFSTSWSDGLAFCALVDSYRPDLIQFYKLNKNDKEYNLRLSFTAAEKYLGVPILLDPVDFANGQMPAEDEVVSYLTTMYQVLEKGQSDAAQLEREGRQTKEKLLNVQNELSALQRKLREQKDAMAEKERMKRNLEKKVENLRLLLTSEKRSKEEIEREHQLKIERLEKRIETAEGGEKARLLEELRKEKESTALLAQKQTDLEKEVSDLKHQIKVEELKTERLVEETRRKEEEKKKLDEEHKRKMKELKRKLLESVQEREILSDAIGRTMHDIEKLNVEKDGVKRNINEKNDKLDEVISDKEQIMITKNRIAQELAKAKDDLKANQEKTHDMVNTTRRTTIQVKREKRYVGELESNVNRLEMQTQDLQQEIEVVTLDVETTAASARNYKRMNQELKMEQDEMNKELTDILEDKDRQLEELDQKYASKVEELQKHHQRDLERIQKAKLESAQQVEDLTDQATKEKQKTDKVSKATDKQKRTNFVMEGQIDIAFKEKGDMESRKREIEKHLSQLAEQLIEEKKKSQTASSKAKKLQKDTTKKNKELDSEKKKKQELEDTKQTLEIDAEQTKLQLSETLSKKKNLEAESRSLASQLEDKEDELEKEQAAQNGVATELAKQHKAKLEQAKRSTASQVRQVETKKKSAESTLESLSDSLESEQQAKEQAERGYKKTEEETKELSKKLQAEAAEKSSLNASKSKLENEMSKARSYLTEQEKEAQREEQRQKKLAMETRKAKKALEANQAAASFAEQTALDLEAQIANVASLLEKPRKKKERDPEKELKKKKKELLEEQEEFEKDFAEKLKKEEEKLKKELEREQQRLERKNKNLKKDLQDLDQPNSEM
mmetsp:Transcript_2185/g.2895  ORF Transcript_2185/g.2895 Transcript_2185/m.2895 type:complete len:868 (+) Transcript_2185:233-2836(+)